MQLAGAQSLDQIDSSFIVARPSAVRVPVQDPVEIATWFKQHWLPKKWGAVTEVNPYLAQSEAFRPPPHKLRIEED